MPEIILMYCVKMTCFAISVCLGTTALVTSYRNLHNRRYICISFAKKKKQLRSSQFLKIMNRTESVMKNLSFLS
jgi:hypothetical protein